MENLRVLITKGSSKFMSSFYVGYGHKSIGDCGTTTLFIEGVSMLTAKAIQDWLLYTGQESSTRYIDFKTQKFINPEGTSFGHELLEKFRSFYVHSMPLVIADLKRRFPKNDSDNDAIYTKAINARAFDILRGFLPAGASTDLAWTSSFRQITDHLMLLRHHPLKEVREVAQAIDEACQEAFPSSFGHKLYDKTESYNESWMKNHYYFKPKISFYFPDFKCSSSLSLFRGLHEYREVMLTRPPKTELPKRLAECGTIQFHFLLDFGSFRDLQRHRSVIQSMPMLTTAHGFEKWYLNELPKDVEALALELLDYHAEALDALSVDDFELQYYLPMGFRVPCVVTGDIPALVYIVELRATRFVHPTLRKRAKQMAESLKEHLSPFGLVLHLDETPDMFDVRRGEHDIVIK